MNDNSSQSSNKVLKRIMAPKRRSSRSQKSTGGSVEALEDSQDNRVVNTEVVNEKWDIMAGDVACLADQIENAYDSYKAGTTSVTL